MLELEKIQVKELLAQGMYVCTYVCNYVCMYVLDREKRHNHGDGDDVDDADYDVYPMVWMYVCNVQVIRHKSYREWAWR